MTGTEANHRLLAGYPVVIEIPVLWGELDAYGHVNNTVYFKYFESARMAYLERCGALELYERDRHGIILYSTECRFRAALHHPDSVSIGARTVRVDDDRFIMAYVVVSQSGDLVAAEGRATLVWFDYNARTKIPLPESVRRSILEIEELQLDTPGNGTEKR